jgi:hypothetical protein
MSVNLCNQLNQLVKLMEETKDLCINDQTVRNTYYK